MMKKIYILHTQSKILDKSADYDMQTVFPLP